jgi:hypothetical protein
VSSNSNNKIKVNTTTKISISKLSVEASNSNYKHLIEITKIKGLRRSPRGVSIFKALIELIKKKDQLAYQAADKTKTTQWLV